MAMSITRARLPAALSHADAALCGARKTAMIVARELEMGRRLRRLLVRAEAQGLVGTIGQVHDLLAQRCIERLTLGDILE
jgi:hypothetical protein